MKKEWQIMPKVKKEFIDKYPDYNPVILQLLFNRGIVEKSEVKDFLEKKYESLYDPFLFRDMKEAISLIIKHIKSKNKIYIYGDYDADGVTASVILVETLRTFKAKAEVYIPDRVKEGYGLNKEAIKKIIKDNPGLIITVDNGIRNKDEVEYIKKKGVDIIITDHHPTDEENNDIPDSLVINSVLKKEKYPFKKLAGAGVAFKLAKALISKSKLKENEKKILEERLLDLVAIGTIADLVVLRGENRILTEKGLEVISGKRRIGLKALMEVGKIIPVHSGNGNKIKNKKIDSWNVGFQIGPRLNAAGRMAHANDAYELLITKDKKRALQLAEKLNRRNIERQNITEEIVEEVEAKLRDNKKGFSGLNDYILIGVCESDIAWNEGVVGLVAGRITEKYNKPTLVITKTNDGYKGSGRSIKGFNLAGAMEECKEFLDKYGGHPMACGFSFKEDNLLKFIEKIKKISKKELENKNIKPILEIEFELDIKEINEEILFNINKFSPFGQGNQKPKILSKKVFIRDIIKMGAEEQHIKFRFDNNIWGLAFGKSEEWSSLRIGDRVDIVYFLDQNDFNGRRELQLKLIDIKAILK
jgi:single-stranded-DNA-specific exonuclease